MKLILVLGCLLGISNYSSAEEPSNADSTKSLVEHGEISKIGASYLMCKSGTAIRTLRVEHKGNACRAYYTKEGVDQSIGRSVKPDGCSESVSKIKLVLENAKWSCRDISQTRVSTSLD